MSNFCPHHIFSQTNAFLATSIVVSDINGIGSVLCLLHRIMAGRGQFQIVDTVCDCVTCVQVSFVTLVCSPSMSVIIADLAKRLI